MELCTALAINKDVIALVGGGGKTTAMFRLAEELVEDGKRVVTTTTTRIFAAQIKLAPSHIYAETKEQAIRDTQHALRNTPHVLVIGTTADEGKAFGIEPSLVDQLIALDEVDVVINEADGSRMRPFKAPGEHEPVIPKSTTLLVPVVGIDVIGQPLDDEHVHRAERVAALGGVRLGASVDTELIARVLTCEQGGVKNKPPHARVIPLVNKVQNVGQLLMARDLANQLLRSDAVEAVAIGAVKNAAMPVAELHQRVSAVILAAGGATRMQGPPKQLLPWGNSTLVRYTVEVARRAQVAEIIVVVGRQAEDVKRELREIEGIRIVENPSWSEGRSTSVRAGLGGIRADAAAAIFINADQPFLTPNVIDTILQRYFQTLAPLVVPVYEGQSGSPVLFARRFFEELMNLSAEYGGKEIFKAHRNEAEMVNILNTRAGIDVDTPEQYRAALAEASSKPSEGIFSTVQGK